MGQAGRRGAPKRRRAVRRDRADDLLLLLPEDKPLGPVRKVGAEQTEHPTPQLVQLSPPEQALAGRQGPFQLQADGQLLLVQALDFETADEFLLSLRVEGGRQSGLRGLGAQPNLGSHFPPFLQITRLKTISTRHLGGRNELFRRGRSE